MARASARLDMREADLVQLAHRWWYGTPLATEELDRVFAGYMFAGKVPPWLRHFARAVLSCDPGDRNVRRRLGLGHLPPAPPKARHGWLVYPFALALAAAIVALCIAPAPFHSIASGPSAPLSCTGGGAGLAAFERLAYAFAGRRPPACPRPLPTEDSAAAASRGGG